MIMQKKSNKDTTIEEIHRTRERMADKFGGDIEAILEDARKRQVASGRPVWQGPSSNKPQGAPSVTPVLIEGS
jgi:hypothetical protein